MTVNIAVMALLPADLAGGFPEAEGVGPHSTALFARVDESQVEAALEACKRYVDTIGPFNLSLGVMEVRKTDDGDVSAVAVESPGLLSLRAGLFRSLEEAGVLYTLTHGAEFWPHATITKGRFSGSIPTGSGSVVEVVVASGDDRLKMRLGLKYPSGARFCEAGTLPLGFRASEAPLGLHVPDKPWRVLSTGEIRSRFSGKLQIREVTEKDLDEMALYHRLAAGESTVPIDWDHDDEQAHFGRVLDVFKHDEGDGKGPGLYVVPGLTPAGVKRLSEYGGDGGESYLYTSPEFVLGTMHSKTTGDVLAGAAVLRLALTPWPKQAIDTISAAQLSEADHMSHGGTMTPEEMQAEIDKLKAENDELKAKLEEHAEGGEDKDKAAAEASEAAKEAAEKLAASERARVQADTEKAQLSERVTQLERQHADSESRFAASEKKRVIDAMLLTGRIEAKEREEVEEAYDHREIVPKTWARFAERDAGFKTRILSRDTHGETGELLSDRESLDKAVRARMSERNESYNVALGAVRKAKTEAA